ncbi:MAG: hypothetical protein R3Y54_02270 [Eubacteriales bacterium]
MKRKKFEKLLAMSIAATMLLGITGCGSSGGETTPTTSTGGTETSGGSTERMDVSMALPWAFTYTENTYCEQLLKEHVPINIDMEKVNIGDMEQVNLMLTNGMPDFAQVRKEPAYMKDQELIRTIPVEMVEQYAPSVIEYYDRYPLMYARTLNPDDPTQFDVLCGIDESNARLAIWSDFYRYDWILDAGIDIGVDVVQISDNFYVAADGLTTAKFEEIMDAYVNGDPDKNGEKDTIGAALNGTTPSTMLMSPFGFVPGINELDGEAAQYYVLPEYKELAKWLVDIYAKGYIDREWLTQTRDIAWEKVNAGKAGYWQASTNAINEWAMDRPPLTLIESNPEVKILMTPGLADDNGNMTIGESASTLARNYYYVEANVSDEKLALILQMYEFTNFGESSVSFWFGEEGVDWEYDAEGNFVSINPLANGEKGVRYWAQDTQVDALWEAITLEPVFVEGGQFWLDGGTWKDSYQYQYKDDLRTESNYAELLALNGTDITSMVETYFADWILGKKDVDTTWDEYLVELDKEGYSEMIQELESIPTLDELRAEYE